LGLLFTANFKNTILRLIIEIYFKVAIISITACKLCPLPSLELQKSHHLKQHPVQVFLSGIF
jgi:hypothetical protein